MAIPWLRDKRRGGLALLRDALAAVARSRSRSETGGEAAHAPDGRVLAVGLKRAHRGPIEELSEGHLSPEHGLDGNVIGRPGRRQVTVLTREGWEAACRELGRDAPWTTRRANLFVEGVELTARVGHHLTIGEVQLEITGEATPCRRMDAQLPRLADCLARDWRAGVTCRVLRGGWVRRGDRVSLDGGVPPAPPRPTRLA